MKREDYEIFPQPTKRWAEGRQTEEPTKQEVENELLKSQLVATNIEIWWDDLMGLWQWHSDITPIEETNIGYGLMGELVQNKEDTKNLGLSGFKNL